MDIAGDAGRLLNSFNIEAGRGNAANLRMMTRALREAGVTELSTPAEIQKIIREVKKISDREERINKIKEIAGNAFNLPKSLMSSMDLSGPLRQGVFLIGRKEFWRSFASMFKQFGSQKAFDAAIKDITGRTSFPLMKSSGLYL